MGRLENKTAIVTGAAGGLGEAQARLFAKEGAYVVWVQACNPCHEADRGRFDHQ